VKRGFPLRRELVRARAMNGFEFEDALLSRSKGGIVNFHETTETRATACHSESACVHCADFGGRRIPLRFCTKEQGDS
jgi:hypothetical protein